MTKRKLFLGISAISIFITAFVVGLVLIFANTATQVDGLSSSTTYYKDDSSNFYTLSGSTQHYHCTNGSHSGSNDYTTSSVSGTCYKSTVRSDYSTTTYKHNVQLEERVSGEPHDMVFNRHKYTSYTVTLNSSGAASGYVFTCENCLQHITVSGVQGYTNIANAIDTVGFYIPNITCNGTYYVCTDCGYSSITQSTASCPKRFTEVAVCAKCSKTFDKSNYTYHTLGSYGNPQIRFIQCSTCNIQVSYSTASEFNEALTKAQNGEWFGCYTGSGSNYCYTYKRCLDCNGNWNTCGCGTTTYHDHSISTSYMEYSYSNIDTSDSYSTQTALSKATGYTVTFNKNGGSGTMSSQYFLHGHSQAIKSNTFTRSGYGFLGWATSSTATTPTYENNQVVTSMTTGTSLTLYAVWKDNTFTIDFTKTNATVTGNSSYNSAISTLKTITITPNLGYYITTLSESTAGKLSLAQSSTSSKSGFSYTTVRNGTTGDITLTLRNVTRNLSFTVSATQSLNISKNSQITDVTAYRQGTSGTSATTARITATYPAGTTPRVAMVNSTYINFTASAGGGKSDLFTYSYTIKNNILSLKLTNLTSGVKTINLQFDNQDYMVSLFCHKDGAFVSDSNYLGDGEILTHIKLADKQSVVGFIIDDVSYEFGTVDEYIVPVAKAHYLYVSNNLTTGEMYLTIYGLSSDIVIYLMIATS